MRLAFGVSMSLDQMVLAGFQFPFDTLWEAVPFLLAVCPAFLFTSVLLSH